MYTIIGVFVVAGLTVFVAWLLERRKRLIKKPNITANAANDITSLNDYNYRYRNIKDK